MAEVILGESFHQLFHAYKRAMRRGYQQADIPLTVSHMRTIKCIHHIPDCTAQAIAEHTQRDRAQITRLVKDLLAESLIERNAHPDDRRSHILRLTSRGEQIMEQIRAVENLTKIRMAEGLNSGEIREFMKLVGIMTENLNR